MLKSTSTLNILVIFLVFYILVIYYFNTQTLHYKLHHEYQTKYSRKPPLRFKQWITFALNSNCLLSGYDNIYNDLSPYFHLSPAEFNQRININYSYNGLFKIRVTNGSIYYKDKLVTKEYYYSSYVDIHDSYNDHFPSSDSLLQAFDISYDLPDMNILWNVRDEPIVIFDSRKNTISPITNPILRYIEDDEHFCDLNSPQNPSIKYNDELLGFTSDPGNQTLITTQLIPILGSSKLQCTSDLLVPSRYLYTFSEDDYLYTFKPWAQRHSKVYWRGFPTGGQTRTFSKVLKFQRQRFISEFQNNPLFDIAFSEPHELLVNQSIWKTDIRRNFTDIKNYKYLFNVDGYAGSARFFSLLKSGGLVFNAMVFEDFASAWLKPFVHYIPIELDYSDLETKVQWAIDNDKEAMKIAENGRRFAIEHLHHNQSYCYTYRLLLEYAKLQGSE